MTHELRRNDLELTDPADIDRILSGVRYVTVAMVDGTQPYLVTLSCGYDAKLRRICFHVAPAGRKLDIIAVNPRACVTAVHDMGYNKGACEHPYESVVMTGTLRLLDDLADKQAAMRTLIGQLETAQDAETIFVRNKLEGDGEGLGRVGVLVFDIERATAKSGK